MSNERVGAETQNVLHELHAARVLARGVPQANQAQATAAPPQPHNVASMGFAVFGSLLDKGLAALLSVVLVLAILWGMYHVYTDMRDRQIAALALLGATNATAQQIAVDLEAIERELDFLVKQQQWGRSYGPPTMQPER